MLPRRRTMSRTQAVRRFTLDDHAAATAGVECRKDAGVRDEVFPGDFAGEVPNGHDACETAWPQFATPPIAGNTRGAVTAV